MKTGFKTWKKHSLGELGPLVSYLKRSISFDSKKQEFHYDMNSLKHYYTIGMMGVAFFSR